MAGLDPRRNLAATAAGVLGLGLFGSLFVLATSPFSPVGIGLLGAGLLSLLAGAAPARRNRFVLLLVAVPTFAIAGFLALFSIGIPVLVVAGVAAYGLLIEYAREGRA